MDFIVNAPIEVTQLGAFDSESDELAAPITVELWSRNDGGTPDLFDDDSGIEILASAEFEGEEAPLDGGTRFSPLEETVVLPAGAYTIVGWGYGANEPNFNTMGNDAAPEGLTVTESPFITFVGGSRFGDAAANGEWPASLDGGPVNRYGAGNFKFDPATDDSDGDGMLDVYEEANDLLVLVDDAGEDKDGDGLTNLEEHNGTQDAEGNEIRPQTFANKADSDEDGLSDKAETATGTWVSAEDTGTNPKNPDSDGDGLSDGAETNTGTFVGNMDTGSDPTKRDTDGGGNN